VIRKSDIVNSISPKKNKNFTGASLDVSSVSNKFVQQMDGAYGQDF
jgi:hypothetical protein